MTIERTKRLAQTLAAMLAGDLVARVGAEVLRDDGTTQTYALRHLQVLGQNLKTDPLFADEFVLAFKAAIADHVYN